MYVRDAKNREEVWLLDQIEAMGLDDAAFRSRDYVVAIHEERTEKAGFGRLRVHRTDDERVCELTGIGVLEAWRGQGVGAHVVERLVDRAGDEGFETVYVLTDEADYLAQFGFESVDPGDCPEKIEERLGVKRETLSPEAVALAIGVEDFAMPPRLREAFKQAGPKQEESETDPDAEESAEDFGIDAETATYKYDTG